ncbi:MAG: CARDB domain-containing protein [Thermoplasmata archaeon]
MRLRGKAGRTLSAVLFAMLLAAPLIAIFQAIPNSSAYSGVNVDTNIPAYAGKSQTFVATITVTGGPAGDIGGNFSVRVEIVEFKNKTGFSVTPSSTVTSPTGVFRINITMPGEAPQTIRLTINATSKATSTRDSDYTVRIVTIKVVDPIVISAEVFNTGEVDAKNVTAWFYADGVLLGLRVFNVTAGSSRVLIYNWTFLKISDGKHVVSVEVDDPNNIVEFSDGNNAFSRTIYVGTQGNPVGAVLTMGIIAMSILVALTYLQKPVKRPKKP